MYAEMYLAAGIAFIVAGFVGVHMMFATKQVAKGLHERFNEQNTILKKMDGTPVGIAASQEAAASQKETISTLKEMSSTPKDIREILQK